MSDWNLLLYAIAHKQAEIVRYFLEDVKVSLRQFGKRPGTYELNTEEAAADVYSFPLLIAINNKDGPMLEALLSDLNAWDISSLHKAFV